MCWIPVLHVTDCGLHVAGTNGAERIVHSEERSGAVFPDQRFKFQVSSLRLQVGRKQQRFAVWMNLIGVNGVMENCAVATYLWPDGPDR